MTTHNIGSVNIRCPECGGDQFIKEGADGNVPPDALAGATCAACGRVVSRGEIDAQVSQIGETFANLVGDAIRKALKN
ncbi:ECs_2282 family putative zinc-binding protein [Paraburkholderia sp. A1RI-2L]|uniref:ECs_2282 family putative zinc-binding protein n=1 Tax=Paraburkholderia sp. A1RI-2L TaxID=3028367 RepID=UPI003BA25562